MPGLAPGQLAGERESAPPERLPPPEPATRPWPSPAPATSRLAGWRPALPLALLLLGGGALRFVGLLYGLPYGFGNIDEGHAITNALAMASHHTLRPSVVSYTTGYFYLLLALYGLEYALGRAIGLFHSTADFAMLYVSDPGAFNLVGRVASALAGTATLAITWGIARRAFNSWRVALLAACALAVSPLHADQSHWAKPDAWEVMLGALAVWAMLPLAQQPTWRRALLAGFLVGLAASFKQLAVLLVPGLAAACVVGDVRGWRPQVRAAVMRLAVVAGGSLAGLLLLSPYVVLDYQQFHRAGVYQSWLTWVSHTVVPETPFVTSGITLWRADPLLASLWAVGSLYACWRRTRADLVLLASSLTALSVLSLPSMETHLAMIAWPVAAALGARAVVGALGHVRPWPRRAGWAAMAAGLAVAALLVARSDLTLTRPDTRVLALRAIQAQIPPGASIAIDAYPYVPPLIDKDGEVNTTGVTADALRDPRLAELYSRWLETHPTYRLFYLHPPCLGTYRICEEVQQRSLGELATRGVDYLILSSWEYERYLESPEPNRNHPRYQAFMAERAYYTTLLSGRCLAPVLHVSPGPLDPGPNIQVLRLDRACATQALKSA